MFLLELIYFLAARRRRRRRHVEMLSWLPLGMAMVAMVLQVKGRSRPESPGLAKTVPLGCKWWKENTSWNPHSDVGFLLCTTRKKHFYNCSSCGLWLRWITNLQPLVFGEKQTVLFWGKNQEPKNHSSLLVYKARVRPKIHFLLCSKPFQWRVSHHLH